MTELKVDDFEKQQVLIIGAVRSGKSELMRLIAEKFEGELVESALDVQDVIRPPKPSTLTIKPLTEIDHRRHHFESMKKFYKK